MEKLAQYALGLKTYFFLDVLNNAGFLPAISTFEPGVLPGDKIGLIDSAGYEEGVVASCNPTWTTHTYGRELTWALKDLGIYKEFCYDNLIAEMKRNQQLYKLSSHQAFLKIVRDFMSHALANSALLNAFFGDTSSANSKLTAINGVFKQVAAFVTADASRRTKIIDGSNQEDNSAFTAPGNATKYLRKLITDSNILLRNAEDAEILMTQATWDALADDMMLQKGMYVEPVWKSLFGGLKETTWQGYRVVVVPAFDLIAGTVQNNALASTPYYALFTTKSNIRIGSVNSKEAGISEVDINDDNRTKTTLVDAQFSIGVVVPDGRLVQVMY